MRVRPAALRPWRSSIRARIVIACAAVFLVLGAILIGAAYTQVGRVTVIPSGPQGEHIEPGRNPQAPRFCDACFTGDYPIPLIDADNGKVSVQLSLLAEPA